MLGEETRVTFAVDATSASASSNPAGPDALAGGTAFTASLQSGRRIAHGDQLTLSIDTDAFYFFDPETGRAIRSVTDQNRMAETA
jgi:hypothetical protein